MSGAFTVSDFIRKWHAVELKERSAAQESPDIGKWIAKHRAEHAAAFALADRLSRVAQHVMLGAEVPKGLPRGSGSNGTESRPQRPFAAWGKLGWFTVCG